MTKELTRMELAAVKRVAANTKSLRGKVEKLNAKIAELQTMKATYLNEIAMWESPITAKYGYSVEEILNGTYLLPENCVACEPSEGCDCIVEDITETVEVNIDEL